MATAFSTPSQRARSAGSVVPGRMSSATARTVLAVTVLAALAAGGLATGPDTVARAVAASGPDLTRLLRAMAALKAVMAAGAVAAMVWRLGSVVTLPWLAGYAAAAAAMAAGPALIWGMAHVGLGAALLHGGLLAAVLLLWRDPAIGARLSAIVAARRAALRTDSR
jgi:hypothetical protein